MRMLAFIDSNPNQPALVDVEYVAVGVGKVTCFECEGRPKEYPKLFPPGAVEVCPSCKGTGWVYISI